MTQTMALKLLGAMIICQAGETMAKEVDPNNSSLKFILPQKMNYVFYTDSIEDLIIKREKEEDIIIPFSEIVEALEGGKNG